MLLLIITYQGVVSRLVKLVFDCLYKLESKRMGHRAITFIGGFESITSIIRWISNIHRVRKMIDICQLTVGLVETGNITIIRGDGN